MAHQLHADLIVSQSEIVRVSRWNEVIALVAAAVGRQEKESLLRDQVIQLEFSKLEVEPRAALQIIETHEGILEIKRGVFIRRGQQRERNVVVERPRRPQVYAGEIESMRGNRSVAGSRTNARGSIHRLIGVVLQVPVRRYAHGDREIRRILVDG